MKRKFIINKKKNKLIKACFDKFDFKVKKVNFFSLMNFSAAVNISIQKKKAAYNFLMKFKMKFMPVGAQRKKKKTVQLDGSVSFL